MILQYMKCALIVTLEVIRPCLKLIPDLIGTWGFCHVNKMLSKALSL